MRCVIFTLVALISIPRFTKSFQPLENGIINGIVQYSFHLKDLCAEVENIMRVPGENMNIDSVGILHWNGDVFKSYNMSNAANLLWDAPEFDRTKNINIFIHGFATTPDTSDVKNMAVKFKTKGDNNFIQFNTAQHLQTDYFYAAALSSYLGRFLGDFLTALYNKGVNPNKIHIIGFSLGAQISGIAARSFRNRHNIKIRRITALDPGSPCFIHKPEIYVNTEDATFLDVIHTSAFSLRNISTGHVEFVANSRHFFQPGCMDLIDCPHAIVIKYFINSILVNRYPASKCPNIEQTSVFTCVPDGTYMGYGVSPTARGVYYVKT